MQPSDSAIAAMLVRAEGNPRAMLALARHLHGEALIALIDRALALDPSDGELRVIAGEIVSVRAPAWHFIIVRDKVRNDAYEAALKRVVTPGSVVLEIGTGSGLLAMMAARAGARKVFTCEMDPTVAATARQIVAANGYADRVTVLSKHSNAIDLAADMGGERADVLVSEIVSNDLLGEEALPAMEYAVPHLLTPGAAVIPAKGAVRVALAEDVHWSGQRMREVSGFDLSAFNRFERTARDVRVGDPRLILRGEAKDLFTFDFAATGPYPKARTDTQLTAAGGPVNGVVQWIALDMDDHGRYENQPGPAAASCWSAMFHPFDEPLDTLPGQVLRISASHDRVSLRVWKGTSAT